MLYLAAFRNDPANMVTKEPVAQEISDDPYD
jgi:hypothetical protein